MAIRFDCEFCGKTLKSDESKAGKSVKCPSCEGLLTIPSPAFEPESDEADADEDTSRSDDQGESDDSAPIARIPCPKCGELKSRRAKICPWCGDGKTKRRRERQYPIADPGKRLIAFCINLFAFFLFAVPGSVLMVFGVAGAPAEKGGDPTLFFMGAGVVLFGLLAFLVVQLYLLINRSQSIGKYMVNIQIFDYETDEPAGFVKTFLLRYLVNQLISAVGSSFCLGTLYPLVDILFIFSDEHRCLHDHLAGTYVVDISES